MYGHHITLFLQHCYLMNGKDFIDVTLACDDEQFLTHKVIASACSPFFDSSMNQYFFLDSLFVSQTSYMLSDW